MSHYFSSDYDQWDIKSSLESARDSITEAISMVDDFEDADDTIAEKAAEQAQDFKNELVELIKEFGAFQQTLLELVDDESDIYVINEVLSNIRTVVGTSDARPWTSKYTLVCRVRDAIRTVKNTRNEEIETHALPTQEG
jgi:hypothetical protein